MLSNAQVVRGRLEYKELRECLPVWVLLWILRFSLRAKTLPQPGKGQGNGFSPVCTLMWLTSLYLALKGRPLREQPCQKHACVVHSGPPTCSTVRCVTISCIELKALPHGLRGPGRSTHRQRKSFTGFTYRKNAPGWSP